MTITAIGIAGPSGSGKTTLAEQLVQHYGEENCLLISADLYYKDNSQAEDRSILNFDHPDMIDWGRLARDMAELKAGRAVTLPTYDFRTGVSGFSATPVRPKPYILVEGILVLQAEDLRESFDTRIFVKTDMGLCLLRRAERDEQQRGLDIRETFRNYKATVQPMYDKFIKPSKKTANIVVTNDIEGRDFELEPVADIVAQRKQGIYAATERRKVRLFSKSVAASCTNLPQESLRPTAE